MQPPEITSQDITRLPVPSHPFTLVEEDVRYITLRAEQNAEIFQVIRTVGQTILALEVGIEQGKTREQILRELYPDDPSYCTPSGAFGKRLAKARNAIAGLGPKIITEQGEWGSKALYFFEGTPPEAKAEDFTGWDKNATCIRFDKRIDYMIVSRNGNRTGARLSGYVGRTLLEHLLHHPNTKIDTHTLYDCLRDVGYDKGAESVGKNISILKQFIRRRLRCDPANLLQNELRAIGGGGTYGLYTLCADRVEIIEDDGSVVVIESSETDEDETNTILSNQDGAAIASSLILKEGHMQTLRAIAPAIQWPSREQLAALSQGREHSHTYNAEDLKQDAVKSLERLKEMLDADDIQKALNNWSPESAYLKSLVASLAQFDKLPLTIGNKDVRGMDVLIHILRRPA